MDNESQSPQSRDRGNILEPGRQSSEPPTIRVANSDAGNSGHIQLDEPRRPSLYQRNTYRGQSTKSVSEALRQERSRQEQETLLGAEDQADDDGCYPPRVTDEPRTPNPHKRLPVYSTIHKIRRLVIATIGEIRRIKLDNGQTLIVKCRRSV